MKRITVIVMAVALAAGATLSAREHPTLLLTRKGVEQMKQVRGTVPMFDQSVDNMLKEAQAALERPICVPEPKDGGGGFTHEAHKLNYYDMNICGVAWQLTGDRRYVEKVKEILLAYCDLYPTLGYHPINMSSVPGRVFWQTLNESVWLLHTAMAYDCVRDAFCSSERRKIEKTLLKPWARFIMEGTEDNRANLSTFNKMHNHGTWATAAVGMAGMAMDDEELIKKALYGTDMTGQHGGFLQQMDYLFSPDGYFTEGAFYHRYAIWPFVMFASCISNYMPELDIFSYRDSIIVRSFEKLVQQAYEGEFMHFNDSMEKGYRAQEIVYALDIVYNAKQSDKYLLSIARDYQQRVIVSDAGFAVARDIAAGQAEPVKFTSQLLHDGKDGGDGAFAIIRSTRPELNSAVTFKATSHGLSHGHYDKLTFAYYDAGSEIISDYGSARFLNIEAKYKGHYTKQNKTYAMSTIAHNTLVADQTSHYKGNIAESSLHSPRIVSFCDDPALQYVCAVDSTAYPDIRMQRWIAYADIPSLEYPLVIDILKADSPTAHTYDYPIHYNGHMINLSVPYERAMSQMHALGEANGYQHLWVEASARGGVNTSSYTWLAGYRMYSISTNTDPSTEIYLLRTGANDPDFNLRSEPAYLIRQKNASSHVFASCLETHGKYDINIEQSANLDRSCTLVTVVENSDSCVRVRYDFKDGSSVTTVADPVSGKISLEY